MKSSKTKYVLLLFILFAILLIVFYLFLKRYEIHPVVEGRIYRSAQLSNVVLEEQIKSKDIKTILNLRGKSEEDNWFLEEQFLTQKYDIDFFNIRLDPNELPKYRKLMDIIYVLLKSKKPLLIHCLRGVDRTGFTSAIALILDKNIPLDKAKEQFSWKYGVLPFYRSVGPYFFSKYEKWLLSTNKKHDKETFLYWAKQHYTDSLSNLEFWIDHVNGVDFKKKKVNLPSDSSKIIIDGWTFNGRTLAKPENISIAINKTIMAKPEFIYDRSDVARFFNLGEEYYKKYIIGWKVVFEREFFSSGCHEISLTIQENSERIVIPTDRSFCL